MPAASCPYTAASSGRTSLSADGDTRPAADMLLSLLQRSLMLLFGERSLLNTRVGWPPCWRASSLQLHSSPFCNSPAGQQVCQASQQCVSALCKLQLKALKRAYDACRSHPGLGSTWGLVLLQLGRVPLGRCCAAAGGKTSHCSAQVHAMRQQRQVVAGGLGPPGGTAGYSVVADAVSSGSWHRG